MGQDAETRLGADHRDELRLWLRLLTCQRLVEAEIRTRLRVRFGETLPRFDLLAQLERAPAGLTLGDLSRRLMVSNGNVTGLVGKLADDGLIALEPDPNDRRAKIVRLTPTGRTHFTTMAAEHGIWIANLLAGLDPAIRAGLLNNLADLKRALKKD